MITARFALPVVAVGIALVGSGCASKKFVRNKTAPIEARVGEVGQETAENTERIGDLEGRVDRDVSRLDERTQSAIADAGEALSAADRAQTSADEAAGLASEAKTFAGAGLDRLERTMIDMTQYRQAAQESIQFGFDSAALSDDAKTRLDVLAAAINGRERYAIELRGFTDSTGAADYNLRLSERRAEAVARHLNANHGVPLRYIHRIGLGQDAPEAENNSREGRQRNRRVEVTLYTPIVDGVQVSQQ